MDIETVKRLIKKYESGHESIVTQAMVAERYYRNENDILINGVRNTDEDEDSPLRTADNRVPSNFHGLLVNQKASYLFTVPPTFDVGSEAGNRKVTDILGDDFSKECKDLCVNASNAGVSWLHLWKDNENKLQYASVDTKQIIPVWGRGLKEKLIALFRTYLEIDESEGVEYRVYEYWTDTECCAFRKRDDNTLELGLSEYPIFNTLDLDTGLCEKSNVFAHGFGEIPFIMFSNNGLKTSDLVNIKRLIDTYDKVYSGFINDLDDIQEIIFVLTGYDGTDLGDFMNNLKKYKTVKLDSDENSGLDTISIQIPIEAREKTLVLTRKAIFEQGMGIDPDPQNFGNSSGVALKYLYSLLELKAGLMETEFRLSFGRFIKLVCAQSGIAVTRLNQTWTRSSVSNDLELADIATKSKGIISNRTIIKNHPWVENVDDEEKQIKEEETEAQEMMEMYKGSFNGEGDPDDIIGKEGDDKNE